ncbi:MAG TPA: hypothetical protein VHT96_03725 [Clostridia bacterium]|nr:hypothetical protein [Clostridia bacterium]
MFEELERLLLAVPDPIDEKQISNVIIEENCLSKRSTKSKTLTARHLIELYSLDPQLPLFRNLLYFWKREPDSRALLALLCACTRDSLLKSSHKLILDTPETAVLHRETMESFIDALEPGRFSIATLKSVAQNINSTWTKSGHLTGRAKKTRARAKAKPAAIAYALYLGYLCGNRGPELFETVFMKMMDCSREKAIELAEIASQRGWIVFKRIGNVMEILFPNLISAEEVEWLRE